MASTQSTADYLVDQFADAGTVTSRKMFGEYALYLNGKVIGFICDDALFIKPTDAGRAFIGDVEESPPYPGATMYFLIDESHWDDRAWLTELALRTWEELPAKPNRRKETSARKRRSL